MICKKCGSTISDGLKFCTTCGSPIEELTQTPIQTVTPNPKTEDIFTGVEQPPINTTPVNNTNDSIYVPTSTIGTYPVYEAKKKSNVWFIVTCIVLGVIILISSVVIIKKSLSLKSDVETDYLDDVDIYEDEEKEKVTSEDTYSVGGYKFVIPTGFKKIVEGSEERIGDSTFQLGYLNITSSSSYSSYRDNVSSLLENLKNNIVTSDAIYMGTSEKSYSGQKFLIFSFKYQEFYNDYVLTELSDGSVLWFTSIYANQVYTEAGYNRTAKFVKSVTIDSNANYSVTSSDFSPSLLNGIK